MVERSFPTDLGIVDTMIGFPTPGSDQYDFIRRQAKDLETREEMDFPVEFLFGRAPQGLASEDPVAATLAEMDRFGIECGMVAVDGDAGRRAVREHPERFVACARVDPNQGMDAIRRLVREHEELGIRAASVFPAGTFPQVPINDKRMYPIYAKCVELGVPIFVCAGVPGPRLPLAPQRVELIDEVMYDFPDLVFVTRHGCEPWEELAVKLMLKWPNLYYSTSAFAPKHYPKAIVDYANTRGATKVIYAGYFPMGLTLERIMRELPDVPFAQHVWPQFLRENALRVLRLK